MDDQSRGFDAKNRPVSRLLGGNLHPCSGFWPPEVAHAVAAGLLGPLLFRAETIAFDFPEVLGSFDSSRASSPLRRTKTINKRKEMRTGVCTEI